MRKRIRRIGFSFAVVLAAGCSRLHRGSSRPQLESLSPSSASAGSGAVITVVLRAKGLTPAANRVFFGSIDLGELPSDSGMLRFVVPQTIPSRSEVPPMAVQPGRYDVHIENARGVSDSLPFVLRGFQD